MSVIHDNPAPRRGRGALSNRSGRYEIHTLHAVDDGWNTVPEERTLRTQWRVDASRSVISHNTSPDIPFDRSVNPYRGCEHGCIYCFARPTHAWLGHSAGLDFERRLYAKVDAADLLRAELGRKGYRPAPIAIGVNTDAWQPLERTLGITRQLLEVFLEARHPVMVITKSALIERDIDLLSALAQQDLLAACISLTTLDPALSARFEPRAAAPHRRLRTMERLTAAGIPTSVSVAPLVPALNEPELEKILEAAARAGAVSAQYILLRLPHELQTLFPEWLAEHYPDRAERVLNGLRATQGKQLYRADFGVRMRGSGVRADIIGARFRNACRRFGLRERGRVRHLDCSRFVPPPPAGQMALF